MTTDHVKLTCPFHICSAKTTGKRRYGEFSNRGNLKKHLETYHTDKNKRRKVEGKPRYCHYEHRVEDDVKKCPFADCEASIDTIEDFETHILTNHSSALLSPRFPSDKMKDIVAKTSRNNHGKILPLSDCLCDFCLNSGKEEEVSDFCNIYIEYQQEEEEEEEERQEPDFGIFKCPYCRLQYNRFSCLVRHVHKNHIPELTKDTTTTTTTTTTISAKATKTIRKTKNTITSDIFLTLEVTGDPRTRFHATLKL